MSVSTKEAIENVRNLSRLFESVIAIAGALEQYESVEQGLRVMSGKHAEKLRLLEMTNTQLAEAQGLVEAAHRQAKQIVEDAEFSARQTAEGARREHEDRMAAERKAIEDMEMRSNRNVAFMQSQVEELEDRKRAASVELSDLESRIIAAKATVAAMLKG